MTAAPLLPNPASPNPSSKGAYEPAPAGQLLLRQAWGLSVDVLVTKGLTRNTIDALHSRGIVNVEDLKDLDPQMVASMPLDQNEKAALRPLIDEVTLEAARARGEVPVKNTFIHFNQRPPSLDVAMDQKPVAQSCPPALRCR